MRLLRTARLRYQTNHPAQILTQALSTRTPNAGCLCEKLPEPPYLGAWVCALHTETAAPPAAEVSAAAELSLQSPNLIMKPGTTPERFTPDSGRHRYVSARNLQRNISIEVP